MELSPKQQAVNEIKNAKRILVLGHKTPDGDHLGSITALKFALEKLDKSVDAVVSEKIDPVYHYLPKLKEIKDTYRHTDGKVLKIDTKKIPIAGMKWQKEEDYLNIYLETEKNLKFEFIEIINGLPKPDLIIVTDTSDVAKIDSVYDNNTELFFEVPILNIDHHPGNEYFGTINLIDLTATSTTEILVSLFEALGVKIDSPDIATCLLTGILQDTQVFRGKNTTPKSLTVAAQLLAAGGRQQEIITNLYQQKPVELLKIWNELLKNVSLDETRRFLWTKMTTASSDITTEDISGAADDLLAGHPDYEIVLILYPGGENNGVINGLLKGTNNQNVLNIAELFKGSGTSSQASFQLTDTNINDADKIVLKRMAQSWKSGQGSDKELWDVIEEKPQTNKMVENVPVVLEENPVADMTRSEKEKIDAIEEALKSISQAEQDENRREFESLRDVIDRKKQALPETVVSEDIFEDE